MNDRADGGGLVQAIADNFDTDTIHCLALLMTQANPNRPKDVTQTTIRRVKKEELKEPLQDPVPIHRYNGPKDPPMTEHIRAVPPLRVLCRQLISANRDKSTNFVFLASDEQ